MEIGRRIYFELDTGNVILDTGERQDSVTTTTVERDIESYKVLIERNRDTFDYIELDYGQFSQDFSESNGYRINLETKEIEFSYPDPNETIAPPIFRKPLSEEVKELGIAINTTEGELASVIFESMSDKMKIAQLESDLGNAVVEIMSMKMGGSY